MNSNEKVTLRAAVAAALLVLAGPFCFPANAQTRVWSPRTGQPEEAEFLRMLPGGTVMFRAANRTKRVPIASLADLDQEIAKQFFMAGLDPEAAPISPFGQLKWDDTPQAVLNKLKADGYDRIGVGLKKLKARDEYELTYAENDDGLLTLSGIPFDATVMLEGADRAVMSPVWQLIFTAGPVWIENAECTMTITFDAAHGLLVEHNMVPKDNAAEKNTAAQQDDDNADASAGQDNQPPSTLDVVPLPDDGVPGPKECVLACLISTVSIELIPRVEDGNQNGLSASGTRSLHQMLMEKYESLVKHNLQVVGTVGSNAGDSPEAIRQRVEQLAAQVEMLPRGEGRVLLPGDIYMGSPTGFRLTLFDHQGHAFEAAIGRVQGAQSGISIRYDLGARRRHELQQMADDAKLKLTTRGRNRASDI